MKMLKLFDLLQATPFHVKVFLFDDKDMKMKYVGTVLEVSEELIRIDATETTNVVLVHPKNDSLFIYAIELN